MLHIFLVDFNNEGHMYRVTVEGEREKILYFLQQYSNDVRYVKSKDNRSKKDKGKRKLPCGTVVSCNFYRDKLNNFHTYTGKNEEVMKVYECNKKQDTDRTVEVFDNGKWQLTEFRFLQKGDNFRMFDDGKPVKDKYKRTMWIALSDAVLLKDVWTINVVDGD